jgi:hypothetical protein
MIDILLKNVYACENDRNLVFTHVPLQWPMEQDISMNENFTTQMTFGKRWLRMP